MGTIFFGISIIRRGGLLAIRYYCSVTGFCSGVLGFLINPTGFTNQV